MQKYLGHGFNERLNLMMFKSQMAQIEKTYGSNFMESPSKNLVYASLNPFTPSLLLNDSQDIKVSVQQRLIEKDQFYILMELTITNFSLNYNIEKVTLKVSDSNLNQFRYNK